LDWREKLKINFTRGCQYHKNGNAYVEQKNGDIVRKNIGYGRLDGESLSLFGKYGQRLRDTVWGIDDSPVETEGLGESLIEKHLIFAKDTRNRIS
jgi:hypothetical protein